MTTLRPKDLVDVLDKIESSSTDSVHETAGELRAHGTWNTSGLFDSCKRLCRAQSGECVKIYILDFTDSSFELESTSFDEINGQEFQLVIRKYPPIDTQFFFTNKGFKSYLSTPEAENESNAIYVFGSFDSFSSHACSFYSFTGLDALTRLAITDTATVNDEVDIRRLIRFMTDAVTPPRVAFWLLKDEPTHESEIFNIWKTKASERLIYIPASEVWQEKGQTRICLAGPKGGPRKRIVGLNIAELDADRVFNRLTEAVTWIVEVPREASLRHAYYASELAREWPTPEVSLETALYDQSNWALEGAKALYEAHVLDTSAEILKSLTELRKAINEEASKTIEKSQNLAKALATSLAAVLGTLLLRFPSLMQEKEKIGELRLTQLLLLFLAGWMLFSIAFTLWSNLKFKTALNNCRSKWHNKIHSILSKREFDEIAIEPMQEAESIYAKISIIVSTIHIAIALFLISFAFNIFKLRQRLIPQLPASSPQIQKENAPTYKQLPLSLTSETTPKTSTTPININKLDANTKTPH